MSNRFKLKNGVLTLVNEKDEVVYESKPTPIKKSFLDKTADFIQNLPEIPTPSFLKLSPESVSTDEESETKEQPNKKEEVNTTKVSTTEVKIGAETVAITSETTNPPTEETKVTDANVTQSEQPIPDPVSEKQSDQPEANSEPKRTEVPETVEAKIETKVG